MMACTTLLNFSCGSQASPLFRPLGGSCSIIYEALERRPRSISGGASPAAALSAAAEFLQGAKSPDLRLQFALLVHTDEAAMSRFVGDVEGAIVTLCKELQSKEPLLTEEGLLAQWRSDIEAFRRRCSEIWELYVYFVFLDVKGDRALLRMVSRQLMDVLEVSPSSLAANLSLTGAWAQPAQQMLAQGLGEALLQRRHRQALEEWHSAVQTATAKACETAAQGVKGSVNMEAIKSELHRQQAVQFWTHYFQTSAKVGWWDFADAFQECFCGNSCPADLLQHLRKHLAKPCKSRVALHSWESFIQKYGTSAPEIIKALVKEVMDDLPATIYKQSSLGSAQEEAEVLQLFTVKRHLKTEKVAWEARPPAVSVSDATARPSLRQAATSLGEDDLLQKVSPSGNTAPPGVQMVPHSRSAQRSNSRREMDSATPQDPRMQMAAAEPGDVMSWEEFENQLQASSRPWWLGPHSELSQTKEPLFVQALQRVQSGLTATRKAVVLRVSSGTLGAGCPRLDGGLPALVITPNDTSCSLTTKFGRGRTEGSRMLQPHVLMTEPIASRSHFSIMYDDENDKFQVMDTGSKWGTFKKVTAKGQPVNCGDWIRIGNAELVVRFCGGGCNCHRRHAHHRLHALGVAHTICGSGFRHGRLDFEVPKRSLRMIAQEHDSEEDEGMTEKVMGILTSRTRLNSSLKNWSSSFERHCRDVNPAGEGSLRPGQTCSQARPSGISLEATPLEIDFISGPRIGERLLLNDRHCTIGRGDNCMVQLSDASLANVSRVHCSFRCFGNRWWLCDEGSTNGTWRRLSCALEPSEPSDIQSGETLLAGVQELKVEEAELSRWWIPSPASSVLSELFETNR